jgi:hypothetical protein
MHLIEMEQIVSQISFEHYKFYLDIDSSSKPFLYARYVEKDIETGLDELQTTRKWVLSYNMTKSELVQTAFKCCLTSMEHRTRESFKYKGRRIFGPHFDVDQLWSITRNENMDVRIDEREKNESIS